MSQDPENVETANVGQRHNDRRQDLVKKGRKIRLQGAFLMGNGRKLIRQTDVEALGGRDGFLRIFTRFYERLHEDPLLNVLFNESAVRMNNRLLKMKLI